MSEPLNAALVGQPDSAARLQTPALIIDLDAFNTNLQSMQQHCQRSGIALRPHAKTHKSVEIARRQCAAGAIGVCCAKLGEAEVMSAGGIASILITSPVVTPGGIERLVRLARSSSDVMVVVDHLDNVRALSAAAQAAGRPLQVLLDLDGGLHRTGIAPGAKALELARQIVDAPGLVFRGLQMYAGHLMHVRKFSERKERSLAALAEIAELRHSLRAIGIECEIVTGGGTGSFDIDVEARVLTELQAGSYLFMDRQYNELESRDRGAPAFSTSLLVQTTIISCNTPGFATTDAGLKAFATDAGPPLAAEGAPKDARYFFFGDEYGGLSWTSGADVRLGGWLRAVPPHCDPTFNLYDVVHVIQDGRLVDIWRVDARGCSV